MAAKNCEARKRMAADMKRRGVTRHICRCPICHRLIGIAAYYAHIGVCSGK